MKDFKAELTEGCFASLFPDAALLEDSCGHIMPSLTVIYNDKAWKCLPSPHNQKQKQNVKIYMGVGITIRVVAIYVVAALMGSADMPKRHNDSAFWFIGVFGFCLSDLVVYRYSIVSFAMYSTSGITYLALGTLLDDAEIWYLQVRRGGFYCFS